MSNPKSAPIGRVWTKILKYIWSRQSATTESIAAMLNPLDPGQPSPSSRDMFCVGMMLEKMRIRGYVRRAYPWTPGKLWAVAEDGMEILDLARLLSQPRKRYRTKPYHRSGSKRRRDEARVLGFCINGTSHGKATRGCRCDACHETHRRSA